MPCPAAAAPAARRTKVVVADADKLQKFLFEASQVGQVPFSFHGYEDINPSDSPNGSMLVLNEEFLRAALNVVPGAEVTVSQVVGCMGEVVTKLSKEYGRGHPLFGGADPMDKKQNLMFRRMVGSTIHSMFSHLRKIRYSEKSQGHAQGHDKE